MSDHREDFIPDPDFSSISTATRPATKADPSASFSDRVDNDVEGLLYLGALSTTARIWGHTFEIHTLRAGEELARDQIIGEYENLMGQGKALGIATIAAAVKSVDGTQLTRPVTGKKSDLISAIRANFNYFCDYYLPVIERLYEEYEKLEVRQARAFKDLEGKS